jgi:hypothetical protein
LTGGGKNSPLLGEKNNGVSDNFVASANGTSKQKQFLGLQQEPPTIRKQIAETHDQK